MNKIIRLLLGLCISALCIWLAFRHVDWSSVFHNMAQARWAWFLPVTIVYLSAHFLRAVRWSVILSPIKKIHPFKLFPVLMFGFLVNNILPARAGEVARSYVAATKMEIPTSTVLGSVALERLTDLIGLIVVMLISLTVLPMEKMPIERVLALLGVGVVLVAVLFKVAKKYHDAENAENQSLLNKLFGFLVHLSEGFASLKSPKTFFKVASLSILIWIMEAIGEMVASRAFGLNLSFPQSCALLSGISFGVMIPAAPGYIGTYEFFGGGMLRILGYAPSLSLPFLVSFHFYQMLICSLMGLPVLIKFGMSPTKP